MDSAARSNGGVGGHVKTMNVELQINNSVSPEARFVSWAPSPCRIRVTNPSGATSPVVNVQITGTIGG